jgi:hypothetical protein
MMDIGRSFTSTTSSRARCRRCAPRATVTLFHRAAGACDDSCGALGDVAREAIKVYACADWRASGIAPVVLWCDLLHWCVTASNFGLLHRLEVDILRRAEVKHDLDLVDAILAELTCDYTEARMSWHAEQAQALRAYAVVAAGRFKRFEATAATIRSSNWLALDAMVDAAIKRYRTDFTVRLLDAADAPCWRQERVRQRRAELSGPHT